MDKISRVPSLRGGDRVIKIDSKKKKSKIKKVDKQGNPIQGAVFEVFNTKTDAEKGQNAVKTITSDKKGNVDLDTVVYYGFYVKEKSVPSPYVVKEDIVSFYKDNGVRFLGEIEPKNMKVGQIVAGGNSGVPDPNGNINEKLQDLVIGGKNFNSDTNWLVFNDNGTEKLIAKKPIKYGTSWNYLYKAGVVFGQKEKPAGYTPTEITINGKKYIVRLIRAYDDKTSIIDRNPTFGLYNRVKGSEWNRLLLPLIDPTGDDNNTGYANGTNGRYGKDTKRFVEDNMPTLANYSWWTDFGGYDFGSCRWAQETGYNGSEYRVLRGGDEIFYDAGHVTSDEPRSRIDQFGWLPVLERVDK